MGLQHCNVIGVIIFGEHACRVLSRVSVIIHSHMNGDMMPFTAGPNMSIGAM